VLLVQRSAFIVPRFLHITLHSLLITLLLLAPGCTLLLKPAEVELVGLSFPGESIVDLTVKLKNPNLLPAKVTRADYSVRVGDATIGQGRTSEVINLGARDSLVARFPLEYNLVALVQVLPQLVRDTVVCRVDGSYRLEALLLSPTIRFSTERRVAVKDKAVEALRRFLGV
jgi:LEA14-like dessication related protein